MCRRPEPATGRLREWRECGRDAGGGVNERDAAGVAVATATEQGARSVEAGGGVVACAAEAGLAE